MSCSSFQFTSQVVQHEMVLNQPVKCQEKNKNAYDRSRDAQSWVGVGGCGGQGAGGGGGGGVLLNSINLLLNLASCPAKMDFEVGKSVAVMADSEQQDVKVRGGGGGGGVPSAKSLQQKGEV